MSLLQKISEDIKSAQKSGQTERLEALRFVSAQLHNREIEKRGQGAGELTDEDVLQVLQKEAKKRKEAIELFRRGGREDLAQKDEKDMKIIGEYLPPAVTREEIESAVDEIISAGEKNFNLVMKAAMQRFGGRADGKEVSAVVKAKLG